MPACKREVFFTEDGTRYMIAHHGWDQPQSGSLYGEFGVYDDDTPHGDEVGIFNVRGDVDAFTDARLIEIAREHLAESR